MIRGKKKGKVKKGWEKNGGSRIKLVLGNLPRKILRQTYLACRSEV